MSDFEQIHFTTRVLGPVAAYRLERHQITQTLRAESASITNAILLERASAGDRLEITLDGIVVGEAELVSMDAVYWAYINLNDAKRSGFDSLEEMERALRRAGYRFKPLNEYQLFRIQFSWLEKANV